MAYTLEKFCGDCRASLKANPGEGGHEEIRRHLEKLLADEDFVAANCGGDAEPGIHTLYHDEDTDFHVLAHIYESGKTGPPHDHGTSWGVYGQAVKHTDMTIWRRLDDGSEDGYAEIVEAQRIRLDPAMAAKVEPGDIHSIHFPDGARFVRVTGTDLDRIPTQRFDPGNKTVNVGSRLEPLSS